MASKKQPDPAVILVFKQRLNSNLNLKIRADVSGNFHTNITSCVFCCCIAACWMALPRAVNYIKLLLRFLESHFTCFFKHFIHIFGCLMPTETDVVQNRLVLTVWWTFSTVCQTFGAVIFLHKYVLYAMVFFLKNKIIFLHLTNIRVFHVQTFFSKNKANFFE